MKKHLSPVGVMIQSCIRRALPLKIMMAWLAIASLPVFGQATEDVTKSRMDDVFGLDRVWKIHLSVSKDSWKNMQPKGAEGAAAPGAFPGFPPPGNPNAPFRPGSFGYEFEYAKADVEFDGQKQIDVGIRFKGNGTYMMSSAGRNRSFKIDFNRFVDDQRFHGMQQINLHNDVMDPGHTRQVLAYEVFAAAGIPSPRTAYAEVSLTIEGECERESLGLYTLVEEVDKLFLRTHFQNGKGMLLKPEGTQGIEYKGESWQEYAWYEAKSPPTEKEAAQFIEFARIIQKADDEFFRSRVPELLDVPSFARFLAANTLLSNMDSFLTQVHNYLVYLPPESSKFVFLPWDLDLAMGAFFFAGTVEQLQELSIEHPHAGENRLIERLMAWPEFRMQYREALRKLNADCFGPSGLTRTNLKKVQQLVQDIQKRQPPPSAPSAGFPFGGGMGGGFGPPASVEHFVERRYSSVLSQLDGSSKGYIATMGMPGAPMFGAPPPGSPASPGGAIPGFGGPGFGGPGFAPPPGFGPPGFTPPPGFGPPSFGTPFPAGNGPPVGFGPGMFLAPAWLAAADQTGDKRISSEEWKSVQEKWFRDWDTDKDGEISESELLKGLNGVMMIPPRK